MAALTPARCLLLHRYTQRGGVRPYGISTIIAGVDPDGTPQLWATAPSGTYSAWKVGAPAAPACASAARPLAPAVT